MELPSPVMSTAAQAEVGVSSHGRSLGRTWYGGPVAEGTKSFEQGFRSSSLAPLRLVLQGPSKVPKQHEALARRGAAKL